MALKSIYSIDYFPLGTINPDIYKVADAFQFRTVATKVDVATGFAAIDDDWCGTGKTPVIPGFDGLGGGDGGIVNGMPGLDLWDMLG